MEVKEAIKIAQTIVNNHNAMTGLINCDVEAIQTLIDHATHPQREALDVHKLTSIIYECKRNGKNAGYTALEIYETFGRDKREALDEGKFKKWLLDFMVVNEIFFQCSGRAHEDVLGMVSHTVCQTFTAPSLEDLLSALPEKIDNITPTLMNANHVCDCYNMAIDACIAALTKRMEELNEKN